MAKYPGVERRSMQPGRRENDRWNVWDRRIRDLGIYTVAISGVVNQIFFTKDPSETLLIFLAAMLGFPLVLRADEFRRTPDDVTKRGTGTHEEKELT